MVQVWIPSARVWELWTQNNNYLKENQVVAGGQAWYHTNQILEIAMALCWFLVLGPIGTNVRKRVLPKNVSFRPGTKNQHSVIAISKKSVFVKNPSGHPVQSNYLPIAHPDHNCIDQ